MATPSFRPGVMEEAGRLQESPRVPPELGRSLGCGQVTKRMSDSGRAGAAASAQGPGASWCAVVRGLGWCGSDRRPPARPQVRLAGADWGVPPTPHRAEGSRPGSALLTSGWTVGVSSVSDFHARRPVIYLCLCDKIMPQTGPHAPGGHTAPACENGLWPGRVTGRD